MIVENSCLFVNNNELLFDKEIDEVMILLVSKEIPRIF